MQKKRRVVVTGLGMVSPLGLDVKTTWANLLQGKSGIDKIQEAKVAQMPSKIAGCIKDFVLKPSKTRHTHKMDLFIQYGLQATREAWSDARLDVMNNLDKTRIGVCIGSGMGGLRFVAEHHLNLLKAQDTNRSPLKTISPFFVPGAIINMLSGICSIEHGLKGPNLSVVTACATGAHNIGFGFRSILYGDADIMLVGGAEMSTTPLNLAGFAACRALSTQNETPQKASRPWDRARDGFVLSDGASVLVLEEYEHAIKRNAMIYGEVVGFGMSSDAYDITAPDPEGEGAYQSMSNALRDANLTPSAVDYINAHATSTVLGDLVEIKAINKLFQNHADRLKISSTKSMTGHLLGASGAIEAAFCLLAIRDQIVPPTINLDDPELACTHLNLVPHKAQSTPITFALSNSFGFGGTNGSLVFKKFIEE